MLPGDCTRATRAFVSDDKSPLTAGVASRIGRTFYLNFPLFSIPSFLRVSFSPYPLNPLNDHPLSDSPPPCKSSLPRPDLVYSLTSPPSLPRTLFDEARDGEVLANAQALPLTTGTAFPGRIPLHTLPLAGPFLVLCALSA